MLPASDRQQESCNQRPRWKFDNTTRADNGITPHGLALHSLFKGDISTTPILHGKFGRRVIKLHWRTNPILLIFPTDCSLELAELTTHFAQPDLPEDLSGVRLAPPQQSAFNSHPILLSDSRNDRCLSSTLLRLGGVSDSWFGNVSRATSG